MTDEKRRCRMCGAELTEIEIELLEDVCETCNELEEDDDLILGGAW